MSGPTVGELFAGYSGAALGLKELWPDLTVKWVSDIEPASVRVLAHRFPDAPNLGDITTVDWSQVEPVDIITGGSPCQDLSHAGKRAGMKAGTRSGLWASMCDAIEALRPQLVVWENVRGALSAESTSNVEPCPLCVGDEPGTVLRALGRVLGDLAELGFDAEWVTVRASDVGACHQRARVFVVAWPADSDGRRFLERHARVGRVPVTHASRDGSTLGLLRTPMADEDGGGPLHPDVAKDRGQTLRLTGQILAMTGDLLLPTPAVNDMGAGKDVDAWDAWTDDMRTKHGNGNGHGKSLEIEAKRSNMWGDYAEAIARHEHALGRPAPAPTLPTGRDGKSQLSPMFEEWMMMLPDGWVTDPAIWEGVKGARNQQVKLFGNGIVPAQLAEAVRTCLERATHGELVA